jgi:flagellin-like hook-associated protein FlgL
VLAAQGASSTATDRAALAVETKQLHEQLVNLTFTASEGRLVFSGDQDQERLYSIDWTQPAGVTRLVTAENTRQIQDVNGSRFIASRTAHEIFDTRDALGNPAEDNVFNALHTLGIALENDDRDAVEAAAGLIGKALDHLGLQTAFYGHTQNRVNDAVELNKTSVLARKTELGLAQDTDLAEALVELNLSKVHMDATLGAQAQMPHTSLFDYLA